MDSDGRLETDKETGCPPFPMPSLSPLLLKRRKARTDATIPYGPYSRDVLAVPAW